MSIRGLPVGSLRAEASGACKRKGEITAGMTTGEKDQHAVEVSIFAFSFSMFAMMCVMQVCRQIDALPDRRVGVYASFLLVCCVGIVSVLLSRAIERGAVRKALCLCAFVLAAAGSLLVLLGTGEAACLAALACLVVALGLNALIWIYYLHLADHGRLVILLDVFFGVAAGLGLALLLLPAWCIVTALLAFSLLFLLTMTGKCWGDLGYAPQVDAGVLKRARKDMLLLAGTGILLGFSVSYAFLAFDGRTFLFLLGAGICVSGMGFGLLKRKFGYKLEDFLYRFVSGFFCLGQFVLPFVSGIGVLICMAYLLTFAFIQLFVAVDAILETIRILRIPPLKLASRQFGGVFAGFCASVVLVFVLHDFLSEGQSSVITIFVLTVIIIFLTASPTGGYPKPGEPEGGDSQGKHFRWDEVFDKVGKEYSLSSRELEVLRLLAKGHSSTHIAGALYISTSTARTHIANIYKKTDVHSKDEMLSLLEDARRKLRGDTLS